MLQASTGSPRSTKADDRADGRTGPCEPVRLLPLRGESAMGPDRDMDLRDAIQRLALEWPNYGRPRITEELRRGDGR
jgi:hypothetical protein